MNSQNKPLSSHERELLERAITEIEAKRALLGDEISDIALVSLREKLTGMVTDGRISHEPQQRKLVTVLFADISGFTAMAETMDFEIVNNVINSLWTRVDKAILDQGGRIDKHIGDAIMALYGTPTAHEDDPERAIRSALQIQSEISDWKREQSEELPTYKPQIQGIQLRIGINTGPALLGTVGMLGEYTAIGDTVNLASRLEHAAPVGGIMISQDVHRFVRGVFDVTALEPIMVKGKSEPVLVYIINGIRPRSFRDTTRGLEGIETRTIGRENELAQMKAVFDKTVSECTTHLITLVAEAGIGKSRLLFEFGKWLDTLDQPALLFKGRATQETTQIPFSLLRGILASSFQIQENDRSSLARHKFERGIRTWIADKENTQEYAHFIGHLIGLDYSSSPHLKGILGDARQIHDRAFHYAAQLVVEIGRQRTIVIFLEDMHFADTGSLDFFEYLMEKQPDLPLLIIGLTRATLFEQRTEWGSGAVPHLSLNLSPLSEADTRLLILEILQKVHEVPEVLIDLIIKKAEGSPFYVEELIRVLIESGVIVRGENQWTVESERLSDLKVPSTLTGLLQARLDGLKPNIRETLQQASVVGRIFWTDIVDHMQNPEIRSSAAEPILDRLGTLRTKEMIFRYEESGSKEALEFIFKNAILHDVTYESVLLRLRPIYHSQAAERLVEIGGERANEYAGRVGEHYERANEWLKAAEWYARAGRQAQNTFASDSAIVYYQKALAFLNNYGGADQVPLKLEVYARYGEVLNWQARYSDATEIYNAMLRTAKENDDLVAESRALQNLSISQSYLGEHRLSLESAIRAETFARNVDAKLELAKALWTQGSARYRLGEAHITLDLAEQALEICTAINNKNEMARCLNLLGAAHYVSGRYDKAGECWEDALKIFQELGNRQQGMDLSSNLGAIADARGDNEEAFQRFDNALTIAREIGYRDGEIIFLTNRGGQLVALKNYAEAEADLAQAIHMAGISGSWCMPLSFNYRAEALIGLGRYEEAFYSARQALVLAEEDNSPEYIGMAWRTLGMTSDRLNKPVHFSDWETHQPGDHDAETCFSKSVQFFTDAEIEMDRARTLREWARLKLKRGNKEEGERMWQEALEIFRSIGANKEVERMRSSSE